MGHDDKTVAAAPETALERASRTAFDPALDPGLAALLGRAGDGAGPRPVEAWNPPFCGDLDMRIAANGRWFYQGTPIAREALVTLFASILRRDADGRFYLVTPVEKVGIRVEDAPFLAVEMHAAGSGETQSLTFRTHLGEVVVAGDAHPLRFEIEEATGGLKPYILVRGRLEARLTRSLAFDLVARAEEVETDGRQRLGVWSGGRFFAFETEPETVA